MGTKDEDDTAFDTVCKEAYNEKIAETLTWANIRGRLKWRNVFLLAFFHAGFIASVIMYTFGLHSVPIKWATIIWAAGHSHLPAIGIAAGVHRLWTHRAYKANLGLRIFLMLVYSIAGINSIYHWVKDHRLHHKYTETDADPHNAKRGFFFSHVGWLMLKRHPEYIRRAKEIDMSDILADPVAMFNKKYHGELTLIFCYFIPSFVPVLFWGETVMHGVITQCFIRHVLTLHMLWSVNSVAHLWGDRPYNRMINPAENLIVSLFTTGEGAHNYHHTFPWDYKAAELPYLNFNSSTLFINVMAKMGWAYDLREPSPELVEKVVRRIGYKSEIKDVR